MAKVEGVVDKAGYKTELTEDEEHGLVGNRNDHEFRRRSHD